MFVEMSEENYTRCVGDHSMRLERSEEDQGEKKILSSCVPGSSGEPLLKHH